MIKKGVLVVISIIMLIMTGSAIGLAGSTFEAAFGTNPYLGSDGSGSYEDFLASLYADINAAIAMGPFGDGGLASDGYGSSNTIANLDSMVAGGYTGTI